MNYRNKIFTGGIIFFGICIHSLNLCGQSATGWEEVESVYDKHHINLKTRLVEDTLLVRVFIDDPVIIDQIRLCGFHLWINAQGKKQETTGVTYPYGFEEAELPSDPGRLEMVLSRLPPFEISDQRFKYAVTRNAEQSIGTFPASNGITASWRSSSEGLVLLYKVPQSFAMIELGVPARIGFQTGVLGRPEITGRDGVGVYGTSPSNPTIVSDSQQRQRLNTYERYREFTVERRGWSGKIVFTE